MPKKELKKSKKVLFKTPKKSIAERGVTVF